MPTQSRGFFVCDYCGLSCDTYEEARDHEMNCPQRPPGSGDRRGPPPGHGQPPGYYGRGPPPPPHHHYGGPPPHEMEGYTPYGHHPHHEQHPPPGYGPPPPQPYGGKEMRAIPLLGPHDRANLAMEDAIACQNIELFEATPEHVADHEQQQQQSGDDQGAPPVVVTVKQVGLRCIHCISKPPTDEHESSSPSRSNDSSNSIIFPGSLGSIAANVRTLADNHLRIYSTIPEVREACERAANKRRQQQQQRGGENSNNNNEGGRTSTEDEEEEGSRLALLDYCVGFCQQLGIVNKQPHKTGIEFADTGSEMDHHYGGGHPAETPNGPREPPPHPYSADRMGPPPMSAERMGYPTPGGPPPPGHRPPPHAGGMIGGPGGEGIAPTPLQRRRDRPGGGGEMERRPPYSAESDRDRSSAGYPTPASFHQGGPPGSEPHYPGGPDGPGIQTPAQPNFEGEGQTPYSAHPSEGGGSPEYHELPSNFPFFQERDGSWHCKFCCHVHPQYRDPQSIWTQSPGPPPGNFIDHHLSMCRAYHQSMPSPPMYQGPPPPYGPPHMGHPYGYGPPPGPWEGHSPPHGAGMHPSHYGQYPPGPPGEPPYGYAPPHHHPDHPPPPHRYPGQNEDPYADPRSRGGPGGGHIPMGPPPGGSQPPDGRLPPNMPHTGIPGQLGVNEDGKPFKYPGITDMEGRLIPLPMPPGQKFAKENLGSDAVRNAINLLVTREQEYFARDPEARKLARLVLDEDRLLLTEYFFFLMKQLRLCRFTESDRKTRGGKREKIKIGYGGLQCIHCCDIPNSRKFFWSNVDRLANSFAEIPGHVLKCRRCPQSTRDAILSLKAYHPEQMARLPRGSQKVFFRRMWRRLHDEDPEDPGAPSASTSTGASEKSDTEHVLTTEENGKGDNSSPGGPKPVVSEESPTLAKTASSSPETTLVPRRTAKEAAAALSLAAEQNRPLSPSSRVVLAIPEDKEWLSDMDCFIRKQLEVFCANADDVATAQNDRKYPVFVGQVGIRCIHCSMGQGATGTAVAFPYAISQIYESVREFQRLHLDSCDQVPPATKSKLVTFKGSSSLSSVLRKYYVIAAKALGLQDTREGIRPGGESIPLSNQAAFSFADTSPSMQAGEAEEKSNDDDNKPHNKDDAVGEASDMKKEEDVEQQEGGKDVAEKTEKSSPKKPSTEKPDTGGDPEETESEKSDDVKAVRNLEESRAAKTEESKDEKDEEGESSAKKKPEESKEEATAEKRDGEVETPAEKKDNIINEEAKAEKQAKKNKEEAKAEIPSEKKEMETPSEKKEMETPSDKKDQEMKGEDSAEMKDKESESATETKDEEMKEEDSAEKKDGETETPIEKKADEEMKGEEEPRAAAAAAAVAESPSKRRSSPRRKHSPSKSTTATTMKPDDKKEENKKRPSDDEEFDRPAKKTRSQGGKADSKKDESEVEEASV